MPIFQPVQNNINDQEKIIKSLVEKLGINDITARLLINRGIVDAEAAEVFLNPGLSHLHDPFLLKDMGLALQRTRKAIDNHEPIVIFGDYDVDGITATAVLYEGLKNLDANVGYYIPNRHGEGYGLNRDAISQLGEKGTKLIITVDCGITAVDEVRYARDLGIDVIITDHHQCGNELPDALAVINPKRQDQTYPFRDLAGVGVAAKFLQALGDDISKYLDIISIGTIADLVPLVGENRIFAANGIRALYQTARPGLLALLEILQLKNKTLHSELIAFRLAPCLNAAGRMGSALDALKLLLSREYMEGQLYARELYEKNQLRQATEMKIFTAVQKIIHETVDLRHEKILVIEGESWHSGVIGIVASKISELYHRPCAIISFDGELGVGSARSIEGFNLHKAFFRFHHLFEKFGGHEMAAGFTISKSNLQKFRESVLEYAHKNIPDEMLIPKYSYELSISSRDITFSLVDELEKLEPFGEGNPNPVFLLDDAFILKSNYVGKDRQHLKMAISSGQKIWDGIAFGYAKLGRHFKCPCPINILTELRKNEWMGVKKIQLIIRTMKKVFRNPQDIESFLELFYDEFFSAFLAEFMYNENVVQKADLPDFASIDMDQLVYYYSKGNSNCLTLTTSKEEAELFLHAMHQKDILSGILCGYHSLPNLEEISENGLIVVPDFRELNMKKYKKIFLLGDIRQYLIPPAFKIHPSVEIYQVHTGVGKEEDKIEFLVERRIFERVYKWLCRNVFVRKSWGSYQLMLEEINKVIDFPVNAFQLRLCLSVFNELGFIQLEDELEYVKITRANKPQNRKLETSLLYQYYQKWFDARYHSDMIACFK